MSANAGPWSATRSTRWMLVLLITYVAAASWYQAARRPFWYDEIFTVTIARLPSMGAVLDALNHAADMNPPGFYVLERAAAHVVYNERIAYRLCSLVSVPLVSLCVFAFVRRRTDPISALLAAVVPLLTVLYRGYAVGIGGYAAEARPYAAVALCIAVALVAWQRVSRPWWLVTLSAALAAAMSLHYYAVLGLGPFVLAEVTHGVFRRRWRVRVWLALAAAAIPFVAFWPLLQRLHEYYGANYWAGNSLHQAVASYDTFLSVSAAGTSMGLIVALSVACLAAAGAGFRLGAGGTGTSAEPIAVADGIVPPDECVLALGFLWLPWILLAASRLGGGGVAPRYALGAVLGLAITSGYVAHFLGRRAATGLLVCVLAVFVSREIVAWRAELAGRDILPQGLATLEDLLARAGQPELPVVITNGLDFVPFAYYARPDTSARLVSLIDPSAARQYSGTDSVDLDLAILRRYSRLPVYEYEEFARTHDAYLMFVTPGFGYWWPARLTRDGLSLRVASAVPGQVLYLVTRSGG